MKLNLKDNKPYQIITRTLLNYEKNRSKTSNSLAKIYLLRKKFVGGGGARYGGGSDHFSSGRSNYHANQDAYARQGSQSFQSQVEIFIQLYVLFAVEHFEPSYKKIFVAYARIWSAL